MSDTQGQFSENTQPMISTNTTSSGGYVQRVNVVAEYKHKENTQKQDHEHAKDMAELKHRHETDILDRKAGAVGRYFGIEENGSKNITFVIIIVFMIVVFSLIMMFYKQSPHSQFVEIVWNTAIPVLTLALGYIFGKE